jgi:hypothetical protein
MSSSSWLSISYKPHDELPIIYLPFGRVTTRTAARKLSGSSVSRLSPTITRAKYQENPSFSKEKKKPIAGKEELSRTLWCP